MFRIWERLGLSEVPQAVLWDLDGTLVDSESAWVAYSKDVVLAQGGIWEDADSAYIFGVSKLEHANRLAQAIARGSGEPNDPCALYTIVEDSMRTEAYPNTTLLPGAAELLVALRDVGVPQVLVTATAADLVDVVLSALPEHYFNALVTGSDPVPAKPDPAPYLLGAKRVGAEISHCLIFEDSAVGLAAARASTANVVDVSATPLVELAALLSDPQTCPRADL